MATRWFLSSSRTAECGRERVADASVWRPFVTDVLLPDSPRPAAQRNRRDLDRIQRRQRRVHLRGLRRHLQLDAPFAHATEQTTQRGSLARRQLSPRGSPRGSTSGSARTRGDTTRLLALLTAFAKASALKKPDPMVDMVDTMPGTSESEANSNARDGSGASTASAGGIAWFICSTATAPAKASAIAPAAASVHGYPHRDGSGSPAIRMRTRATNSADGSTASAAESAPSELRIG